MARLTHPRVNGIKAGYWSPAKKDDLIGKLGPIEEKLPDMLEKICKERCKYLDSIEDESILWGQCDHCPMNLIDKLIDQ